MSDLITQAEAARLRNVSPQAISDLIKRHKLKTKTIGTVVFVYRSSVLAYRPEKGGRPAKNRKAKV